MYDKSKIYLLLIVILFLFFLSTLFVHFKHVDKYITYHFREFSIINFFRNIFFGRYNKLILEAKKLYDEKNFSAGLKKLEKVPDIYAEDFKDNLFKLRGVGYKKVGELEKSKQNFIKARNLRPKDINVLEELAVIYQKEKEYEKAKNCLSEILHSQPDNTKVKLAFSKIYDITDEKEEKIKVLKDIRDYKNILLLKITTGDKLLDKTKYLTEVGLNEFITTGDDETKEVVYFYGGNTLNIRLEANSEIIFDIFYEDEVKKIMVKINKGEIFIVKKGVEQISTVEFRTQNCKIIPYGTIFLINYNDVFNIIKVKVLEGIVKLISLIEKNYTVVVSSGEECKYSSESDITKEKLANLNEYKDFLLENIKKIDFSSEEIKELYNKILLIEQEVFYNFNKDKSYLFAYRFFKNAKNSALEYKRLKVKIKDKKLAALLKTKRSESLAWLAKAKKQFEQINNNKKIDKSIRKYVFSSILPELKEIEEFFKK